MSDVFISYKREERGQPRVIAKAVASRGYDTWWDVELLPGDKFADEIEAVIQRLYLRYRRFEERALHMIESSEVWFAIEQVATKLVGAGKLAAEDVERLVYDDARFLERRGLSIKRATTRLIEE